jgi:hypothetical protein
MSAATNSEGRPLSLRDDIPVLSEPELLRAMFDVGYFPPNTPPPVK